MEPKGRRKKRKEGEEKKRKNPWPCPAPVLECHMHPPLAKPGVLHLLHLSVAGFLLCSSHLSWLRGSR